MFTEDIYCLSLGLIKSVKRKTKFSAAMNGYKKKLKILFDLE